MRDYVLTILIAAAVTYLLTPLVQRLAGQIGAMKQPRDRDVHVVPVPTLGGLAMYGGLAAGLLVADQIPLLRSGLANTGMITGLLLAGGLLVVIGFIDDRWGMDALPKAAGQVAAGGILVATGTSLSWLPLPGGNTFYPTTDQAAVLTILVVVATINAVNFIDGLDGLAAGIVCIAAVSFFLYYYTLAKVIHLSALAAAPLASAILIGMCLGFLPHNFSPAKIFMGDTGSMLLGLLLAYAPISSIDSLPEANLTSQFNRYPVILPLLLPAALLVIPYGDMLLAVVRRTRAGRSPFAPDRKHLHHRLLDIGHSQRASVLIMYLWAAAFSGSVVGLSIQKTVQRGNSNHHGAPIFVFVVITAVAFAVLLLLSMPRLRWWQRSRLAGSADAGSAGGAGPALEAAVLDSPGPATPVLESTALESTGAGGPRLVGMTAGPVLSSTGSAGEAPSHGGRLGRASAEPGLAAPPFAPPPSAAAPFAPPSANATLATRPSATAPFATAPAEAPPFAASPSPGSPLPGSPLPASPSGRHRLAGSQLAGTPLPASPSAAQPLATSLPSAAPPVSPSERSSWHADQATPNGTESVRSLAFWRNSTANPSDGARLTPARPDMRRPGLPTVPGISPAGPALPSTGLPSTGLPSTGLPSTGLPSGAPPSAGRSVIGTPPPAVSGQQVVGGATHRASTWRPEMPPPPAADGNKTGPDGLR